MSTQQAEKITTATITVAKLRSDPVIIRYEKLLGIAEAHGMSLKPIHDEFFIKRADDDLVLGIFPNLDGVEGYLNEVVK